MKTVYLCTQSATITTKKQQQQTSFNLKNQSLGSKTAKQVTNHELFLGLKDAIYISQIVNRFI